MSNLILTANVLTFLAFVVHTFVGDKEIKELEPSESEEYSLKKTEKWTMARCGWHWVSFDLLFASIGLGIINFTDYLHNEKSLLQILSIYFSGYAISWFLIILISKRFSNNFLKLGQWILLVVIAILIQLALYYGSFS